MHSLRAGRLRVLGAQCTTPTPSGLSGTLHPLGISEGKLGNWPT